MTAPAIQRLALHHRRVSPKTVWSFLELTMTDGSTGWGEATLIAAPQSLDASAAQARAALAGATLDTLEAYVARQPIAPIAQTAVTSALEQASGDLRARHAGCSAWQLGGEPARREVALYGNINRRTTDRSPAGFLASARQSLAVGFSTLKIAPFDGVTPDNCGTPRRPDADRCRPGPRGGGARGWRPRPAALRRIATGGSRQRWPAPCCMTWRNWAWCGSNARCPKPPNT